jgi:membrane-associated protease RseP (regulator of RpoE activity)
MSEKTDPWQASMTGYPVKHRVRFVVPLILFLATFLTTSIAGTQWASKDYSDVNNWHYGITYAILILTFLASHEFGHFIASRIHKVDATLPYFIPVLMPYSINFGTFGAVIRTRTPIPSRKALFDIGVAGPIAGFVVCLTILIYGLQTLPPKEFIYQIHPEYLKLYAGKIPETSLFFGDTILFNFMARTFANPQGWLPPFNEIYHYPFLCVGWFGLFVTTLNMLPIGQLDGGHVTFAMFGRAQRIFARAAWWIMVFIGFGSVLGMLYGQLQIDYSSQLYITIQDWLLPVLTWIKTNMGWYFNGWGGWLFWAVITRLFIRLDHPPVADMEKLGTGRMLVGWISIVILFLSFSWNGIYFIE